MQLRKKEIPNYLTYARALSVVLALVVATQWPAERPLLFWIFTLAALTDFFDGYLARRWKVTSDVGALLDPIADKLLVVLMLLYILKVDLSLGIVLPIMLIVLRELYVSGLREYLGSKKLSLPVSKGGKWKTATQMLAIGGMLGGMAYHVLPLYVAGRALLWVAALLAVVSAIDYTRKTLAKL